MAVVRVMFKRAQWIDGKRVKTALIDLDHVVAYRNGEAVVDIGADDLEVMCSGDFTSALIAAARADRPQAYTRWTQKDDDLLRNLWEQGVPLPAMAGRLGRKYGSVRARARKLGLQRPPGRSGNPGSPGV